MNRLNTINVTESTSPVIAHEGYARFEKIVSFGTAVAQRVTSPKATSTFLLAAAMSTAMVVVQQIVDQWSQGIAAWMVLWAAAFVSMALFSNPARRLGVALREFRKALEENRLVEEQNERVLRATLYDAYMAKNRNFAA